MAKKKLRIEVKLDNMLKGIRIPISKVGGTMLSKKGKGSYNRKNKDWKKEYSI